MTMYPLSQAVTPYQSCEVKFSTRFCLREKFVSWLFSKIDAGRLTVILPNGIHMFFEGAQEGPDALMHIHHWRMIWKTARKGDLGFADSYIDGDWDTPDLTAVIRIMARNSDTLFQRIRGIGLFRVLPQMQHALRSNSKSRSRKNIEAHYDLGNAFYAHWLDSSMLYSSGIWTSDTQTLEQSQQNKVERIATLLEISSGQRILEIGCGWGALAIALAMQKSASVDGITLSPAQLAFANTRVEGAGVRPKVSLDLQDYRDIHQRYDRIVSIEMIEAVGEAYMHQYFDTIARCLKDDGRAVIQAITIADDRFDVYRNDTDFIQTYIFPGGFLPSATFMLTCASHAGLKLVNDERFGQSYAKTLLEWQVRFNANWPTIKTLGFDEKFRRVWNYYLSYCAAGFNESLIDVGLYVFERAQSPTN